MPVIAAEDLTHVYLPGTLYEKKALDGVTLSVGKGEFFGIVGANGSGKSTLLQHLNGLLRPTAGRVTVLGMDTREHRDRLWKKVGLVFQYPEQQLFEVSVLDDVSYGPRNLGLEPEEVRERSIDALRAVGLDPDAVAGLPPLALSGGMRRRVAIAGVLAMRPEVLVLDEPTAGLDPPGRRAILHLVREWQREGRVTVVMVSHSLGELLPLAGRIAVLAGGRLLTCGSPADLAAQPGLLAQAGLQPPDWLRLLYLLAACGRNVDTGITTAEQAEAEIVRMLEEGGK